MGMIDERHDVPSNVPADLSRRVTVEYFIKGEPGIQVRHFDNRWQAERFHLVMVNDPNCEAVGIRRER